MSRRLALVLVLVTALAPAVLAGCGGDDEEETEATPPPAETAVAGGGEEAPAEPGGDAAAGATVFVEAGCGNCHTLADAGSSGSIGPNLDQLGADFDTIVEQVTNGGGGMPAFGGELTQQEIADVAAYVSSVASG